MQVTHVQMTSHPGWRREARVTEDVFDLLDHAVEPDAWECDGDWEYRAMHWRPSSDPRRIPEPATDPE